MFLPYCTSFLALTLICNNLILYGSSYGGFPIVGDEDMHNKLMKRARTLYPKPRPIDDPITLDDINAIVPNEIQIRKQFIDDYKGKLSAAQQDEKRWNSRAWNEVRGKLWRIPIYMNKPALNYFGYNEFLQFQPESYKYYSTKEFTEFFKKQLDKHKQNKLVKKFMRLNEEIIRIRQEIDDIGTLRHFINGSESLQSDLHDDFKKLSKQEALAQLQDLEKYQSDLNKNRSPLIVAEMKRPEYQKAVTTLKDIRDYAATMEGPKKTLQMKKTVSVRAPVPMISEISAQQPVTIQTAEPTPQKAQSYWEAFKGYMARMARMFGL